MFDNQRAVVLEWLNEAVAIARRPVSERPALWETWQTSVDRARHSRHGAFTATLPILLTPALSASSQAHGRYQSGLGATAILLAFERHRRKAGVWPVSIGALDAAILRSPPVDPYSGEAYHMERRDGQVFIYSIGPNHQDEHGAFEPKQYSRGKSDDFGGRLWDVHLRRQPPAPRPE